MKRVVVLSLGILLVAATSVAASDSDGAATRALMARIFESVRVLLPLTASRERFGAPARQEAIRASLTELSRNARVLGSHGADPRSLHLGSTLARDARDALRTYEHGQPEAARFLVQRLTESCIACHARLPSGDSPRAEALLADEALAGLSAAERAGLQMATRRFEAALDSFEELLSAPQHVPASLLAPLTDYLILAVRVKQDPERAVPVLRRFARRPDLWRHLRVDVEFWIRSLGRFGAAVREPASLDRARSLLLEAREQIRFPADRRALVHYVVASSLLHRLVEADAGTPTERAEAYYWLGLVESRIGRNDWVSQSGALLEAAIRLAPKAAFAETAYAILEEETLYDYGELEGGAIPEEVAANLAELRDLLDR